MSDEKNNVIDFKATKEMMTIAQIIEAIRKHSLAHNDIFLYFPNGMQVKIPAKNESLLPKEI